MRQSALRTVGSVSPTTNGFRRCRHSASFEKVITPEQFGAVGDANGLGGGTDDSVAVQAAFTAAQGVQGAVVLLRKPYRVSTGITISDSINVRGVKRAGLVGDSGLATVLDYNGGTHGKIVSMSGFSVALPPGATGTALSLRYGVGKIENLALLGGTALRIGDGLNETFFHSIYCTGEQYAVYYDADVANGENSFSTMRLFGRGSGLIAGWYMVSDSGGDIGGIYMHDVVAALAASTNAGASAVGFWFDGSASAARADHPVFMTQCVADNVTVPFRMNHWGNVTVDNSWSFSVGTDVFQIENDSSDITIVNGRHKGGTNFIRFSGASSRHITHMGNRIPDATNYYAVAGSAPADLMPGVDDTAATISSAARAAIFGAMRNQKPYLRPSRIVTHSSDGTGAQEIHNELGNIRYLRVNSSGDIEILNSAYSLVDLIIKSGGGLESRGVLRTQRADTAFLPSAATAGAGATVYDQLVNRLLVSDGANWMNNTPNVNSTDTTMGRNRQCYVYTGTGGHTYTMPSPSGEANKGHVFLVKNRGSGSITVTTSGGGSGIYETSAVASVTIATGGSRQFFNDGTYWNAL